MKAIGVILLVLAGLGLVVVVFSGSLFDLARDLPWWTFLMLLPVFGIAWVLLETVFEIVGAILFGPIARVWNLVPRWLQVCAVVAGPLLVIGGAFWLAGQGGGYDPTVMTEKH